MYMASLRKKQKNKSLQYRMGHHQTSSLIQIVTFNISVCRLVPKILETFCMLYKGQNRNESACAQKKNKSPTKSGLKGTLNEVQKNAASARQKS